MSDKRRKEELRRKYEMVLCGEQPLNKRSKFDNNPLNTSDGGSNNTSNNNSNKSNNNASGSNTGTGDNNTGDSNTSGSSTGSSDNICKDISKIKGIYST